MLVWFEGGVLWSYNPRYIRIHESQMDECGMTCVKLWHSITTNTPIKLSRHCIRHRPVQSTDVQQPRGYWTKDRWWKCLNVKYSFGYKTMKASPLRPFLMLDWNQLTIFICRSVELDKFIFTFAGCMVDGWQTTSRTRDTWHIDTRTRDIVSWHDSCSAQWLWPVWPMVRSFVTCDTVSPTRSRDTSWSQADMQDISCVVQYLKSELSHFKESIKALL